MVGGESEWSTVQDKQRIKKESWLGRKLEQQAVVQERKFRGRQRR